MRYLPAILLMPALLCLTACPGDDVQGSGGTDDGSTSSADGPTSSADGQTSDGTDGPTSDGTDDPTDTTDTEGSDETFCIHQCRSDDDCLVGGMDVGLSCLDNHCQGEGTEACATDEECVAVASGWRFGPPCTAGGGECAPAMQVCVEIEGAGHCVTAPNDFVTCADFNFEEIEVTDIDGNMATVCGAADATCHADGYCFNPCSSDADCTMAAPICNVGTGLCECGSDADCETTGLVQFSSCNAGVCGCGQDQDCVDATAGDVCHPSGLCGCSGDMACEDIQNTYDGGMIVCAPPGG